MRRFTDAAGDVWDVVVGRESWGALYALFVPVGDDAVAIRQTLLAASGYEQAQHELHEMTEPALAELLRRSVPKQS